MRANFVDTVMARLDGEVATIWATVLLRLEDRPDVALLRRGLRALVRESERLNVAWNDARRAWVPAVRGDAEVDAALVEGAEPLSEPDAVARIINTRVDLTRDVPLRLHLHPMVDAAQGPWLLGIQLHHAIGDAKALAHLLERLWLLCAGRGSESRPLEPSTLTDGKVLLAALRQPGPVLGSRVRAGGSWRSGEWGCAAVGTPPDTRYRPPRGSRFPRATRTSRRRRSSSPRCSRAWRCESPRRTDASACACRWTCGGCWGSGGRWAMAAPRCRLSSP
ncbi:hypothetical protein ACLEPN_36475 [Myxococcus sp. 1LA]